MMPMKDSCYVSVLHIALSIKLIYSLEYLSKYAGDNYGVSKLRGRLRQAIVQVGEKWRDLLGCELIVNSALASSGSRGGSISN
jgi:hypothetical protein